MVDSRNFRVNLAASTHADSVHAWSQGYTEALLRPVAGLLLLKHVEMACQDYGVRIPCLSVPLHLRVP